MSRCLRRPCTAPSQWGGSMAWPKLLMPGPCRARLRQNSVPLWHPGCSLLVPRGFLGRCGCTEGAWAQGAWCSYRTGDAQGHAQHHPMVTAAPSNGLCLSAFHPKRLPEEWGNPSPGHSPKWIVWTEWDAAQGETQPMGPIFAAKPAGSSPLGKHTLQSPPAP